MLIKVTIEKTIVQEQLLEVDRSRDVEDQIDNMLKDLEGKLDTITLEPEDIVEWEEV